jgi:hypothetical protein
MRFLLLFKFLYCFFTKHVPLEMALWTVKTNEVLTIDMHTELGLKKLSLRMCKRCGHAYTVLKD